MTQEEIIDQEASKQIEEIKLFRKRFLANSQQKLAEYLDVADKDELKFIESCLRSAYIQGAIDALKPKKPSNEIQ
jgi:hypothetical protein